MFFSSISSSSERIEKYLKNTNSLREKKIESGTEVGKQKPVTAIWCFPPNNKHLKDKFRSFKILHYFILIFSNLKNIRDFYHTTVDIT